jgi:tartrate dehydratase alpha subunit/fumarate hydratase class I-like protein
VQDNWNRAYLWGIGLGLSPDTATLAANKLTTAAYDIQLAKENPNFWDKVAQEEKNLGISKSPMVPVITPDTLKLLSKTIFKRDLDLSF